MEINSGMKRIQIIRCVRICRKLALKNFYTDNEPFLILSSVALKLIKNIALDDLDTRQIQRFKFCWFYDDRSQCALTDILQIIDYLTFSTS